MMIYRCDGCGNDLPKHALRYSVTIDVRAAYDRLEVGLAELVRDHRAELLALIEKMRDVPADRIEESVYKEMKLDLCPSCQKRFVRNPLEFRTDTTDSEGPVDIDGFLRSLGYGKAEDQDV